jgi:hypothetical protein
LREYIIQERQSKVVGIPSENPYLRPCTIIHICNSSTHEAEKEEARIFRPAWATQGEPLSKNKLKSA